MPDNPEFTAAQRETVESMIAERRLGILAHSDDATDAAEAGALEALLAACVERSEDSPPAPDAGTGPRHDDDEAVRPFKPQPPVSDLAELLNNTVESSGDSERSGPLPPHRT